MRKPAPIWPRNISAVCARVEIGQYHHVAGAYLLRYAQEASLREDNRRVTNGEQTQRVALLA